jgi:hypothetical protein
MLTTYKNRAAWRSTLGTARFEAKIAVEIAVLLRDDLEMWQRSNVTGLCGG